MTTNVGTGTKQISSYVKEMVKYYIPFDYDDSIFDNAETKYNLKLKLELEVPGGKTLIREKMVSQEPISILGIAEAIDTITNNSPHDAADILKDLGFTYSLNPAVIKTIPLQIVLVH